MWMYPERRKKFFQDWRKIYPNRPFPYTYKEMRDIGDCLGLKHKIDLWRLRINLRELALITWQAIDREGSIKKSDRRDAIHNQMINPIDQLLAAFKDFTKTGTERAFSATRPSDLDLNLDRLRKDLYELRGWSEKASIASMGGSIPKGKTIVRQEFVDHLMVLFLIWTGEAPGREVSRDRNVSYDESSFTRFVRLSTEPVFGSQLKLTRQIIKTVAMHAQWMTDAQNIPSK